MNHPVVVEDLNTESARLPAAYRAAQVALANCVSIDECQEWANKAQALASYARQADDDTLEKQAMRIRSRAIRRCGELLKDYTSAGGRPPETADATVMSFPASQKQAAEEAGMSERQRVTAVRVANVPEPIFEAAIESDEPPTVTKLAEMGKATREDKPVPPGFQAATSLMGLARRLAEFCQAQDPAVVAAALDDHERPAVRRNIAHCRRWLKTITPMLRG